MLYEVITVPDVIPFVDELLLGLMTLLLAAWKKRRPGERALETDQGESR